MSKVFEDCVIALTGTMSKPRSDIQSLIKKHGGVAATGVSKKVTHLIATETGTSTYDKAESYGIDIVKEEWLFDSIEKKKLQDIKKYLVSSGSNDDDDDDDDDDVADSPPKKKAPAKKAAPKKTKKDDEDDDEDEPPKKKAASKRKRDDVDDDDDDSKLEEEAPKVSKLLVKGKAPVDEDSGYVMSGEIYCDKDVWSVTLNQTDVKAGVYGHNKFYKIQLIQSGKQYIVYTKYGRVGAKGKGGKDIYNNLDAAKECFCKKFKEKTKNEWSNKSNFKPVKGKYDLVEMNYDDDGDDDKQDAEQDDDAPEEKTDKKPIESKLDPRVQDLMKLISNVKMMEETMRQFEIDLKKMPLGKLSKEQIKKGYQYLKRIQNVLDNVENDEPDDVGEGFDVNDYGDLSSRFYTIIPHDFGRAKPPQINSREKLQKKMDMMSALADLEIASKLISGSSKEKQKNQLDSTYDSLKTELKPIDHDSEQFKMIQDYIKNTHAVTHNDYKLVLEEVFEVEREGERDRFTEDIGNRQLLWHGSRITNYMGILSTGLRIAPPEAPVTGYMFGKGVYFADSVSKSANYCFARNSNNTGVLLLSEVALGKCRERYNAEFVMDLPNKDHQSTKGVGRQHPDPKGNKTIEGDVVVPMGKMINQEGHGNKIGALQYNEFIVYDVKQINIKYLLKTKFVYK